MIMKNKLPVLKNKELEKLFGSVLFIAGTLYISAKRNNKKELMAESFLTAEKIACLSDKDKLLKALQIIHPAKQQSANIQFLGVPLSMLLDTEAKINELKRGINEDSAFSIFE